MKLREGRRVDSDVEMGGPTGGIACEFRLFHQTQSVQANRVSPANMINANASRVSEVLLPLIFIYGGFLREGVLNFP